MSEKLGSIVMSPSGGGVHVREGRIQVLEAHAAAMQRDEMFFHLTDVDGHVQSVCVLHVFNVTAARNVARTTDPGSGLPLLSGVR